MTVKSRTVTKKRAALAAQAALLAALLGSTAGCHPSDGAVASPPARSAAQNSADSIAAVQANPNIPPQQKASIIAHIQGKDKPPTGTTTAHP